MACSFVLTRGHLDKADWEGLYAVLPRWGKLYCGNIGFAQAELFKSKNEY